MIIHLKKSHILIFLAFVLASNKDLRSANEIVKKSQVMYSNSLAMRDVPDTMCGPHCLWQIARTFGKSYSLGAIRNLCGTDAASGTSVSAMVKASRSIGLKAKAVKTDMYYLKRCSYISVMLLHYDRINHFVIFDRVEGEQVKLLDGSNYKALPLEQLKSTWKGYVILISDKEFVPKSSGPNVHRGTLIQIFGLLVILIALIFIIKCLAGELKWSGVLRRKEE